jgi:hypothetical protein
MALAAVFPLFPVEKGIFLFSPLNFRKLCMYFYPI